MIGVYIHMTETYDLGIGGFKPLFILLWLFHPSVGALPAMPSAFGCTESLCHLLQQAAGRAVCTGEGGENSEKCLGDLHGNNSAKEF